MKYSNLIVIIFITIAFFAIPSTAFAYKEAGTSASISAQVKKHETELADLNMKRKVIREILVANNSPLTEETDAFIDTCVKYKIDCYLLPSIAGLESSFGKFVLQESHNPFGWGGGHIMFDSWADCIDAVGKGVRENYIDKWEADTIEEMAPYYAASPTWAVRVRYFHTRFEELEKEKQLYFSDLTVEL